MNIRNLINEDGNPFDSSELQAISHQLDNFDERGRENYRNKNAEIIAKHHAARFLIISGPGTGKSHLFLDRIKHWYQTEPQSSILVTSFVRKLVADLQSDINNDNKLSDEQKSRTTATTLHKFARSVVEKNHGTSKWKFQPYFKIIGQFWKEVIWKDVLAYYPVLDKTIYGWKGFEEQLHNNDFIKSEEWDNLKQVYFELCKFYNAAGFADLIIRAKQALKENVSLNQDSFFIIDEYQDFNQAEESLIQQLVSNANGLLIVGDDDQVLYEKLKFGKATLIRNLYKNNNYAKGMLPFCGRSDYHITKSAAHFIQKHRDSECIEKIYLPLKINLSSPKLQVIACATSGTAVDYIKTFVSDKKNEIDERKRKLSEGEAKDAFLLILTPARQVKFYGKDKEKIVQIIAEYRADDRAFSDDYYRILNYYSLSKNCKNNFTFRKVLFYENVSIEQTHAFLLEAIQNNKNICDIDSEIIKNILIKCNEIKDIIDSKKTIDEILDELSKYIVIKNRDSLKNNFESKNISQDAITRLEHEEEEEAELEEIEVKKMNAVELMTIVGSKGLSADHVIIIGFDDVNMKWVTKNAFYVAMTRARKSLHILTALKSGGSKTAHNFLNQLPETHIDFYSYKKSNHSKTTLNGKKGFNDYLRFLSDKVRNIKM